MRAQGDLLKIKVSEITNIPYGQFERSCEPTHIEIKECVDNNDVETRSFQGNIEELRKEFFSNAKDNDEIINRVKKYHCQRIAYFVLNRWAVDPIELSRDMKTIVDGLHRLKAAIYLGLEEVEAITSTK